MIILLRHPAGIIDSFIRLGWLKVEPEYFAYRYGNYMANAIQANGKNSFLVQLYEDTALKPEREFLKIYNFMGVEKPLYFTELIEKYCKQNYNKWKPHRKKRLSEKEVHKWKYNLDKSVVEAVKKGYFRSDLKYYRDQKEWEM